MTENLYLTAAEARSCEIIRAEDHALRGFLDGNALAYQVDTREWLGNICVQVSSECSLRILHVAVPEHFVNRARDFLIEV